MKWYHYVICIGLIIFGIFSAINVTKLFSITSADYGTVETIVTKNNYTEVSRFDCGILVFGDSDDCSIKETFSPCRI